MTSHPAKKGICLGDPECSKKTLEKIAATFFLQREGRIAAARELAVKYPDHLCNKERST